MNRCCSMDFFRRILNLLFPFLTLLLIFLFSPFYLSFKFLSFVTRRLRPEKLTGKVVLITGASSGIGEHLAYEYARRGARLALVARREDRLRAVADESRRLGSPEVIVIRADVSAIKDCKRFVDETVDHFGKLDHLVNNAGVVQMNMFEDYAQVGDSAFVMNINFWGSVYSTHFAFPHLKKSKGKIVVVASAGGKLSIPLASFYCASKAALINFYETLRIESGSEIGITIINPGMISSEMTTPKFVSLFGFDNPLSLSTGKCAKAIVDSVCCRERCLTQPYWVKSLFWLKTVCPEVLDCFFHNLFVHKLRHLMKQD